MLPRMMSLSLLRGSGGAGGGGGLPANLQATLTIAAGEVTADLTDFPVRVALRDMPAGFWAAVAADGSDIQVFDSGLAQLPRDLVNFDNTNDTGDLFFKAPSLLTASDNVFYICAGSGAAAPAVGDTYGRNAVWSSYFRAFAFAGGSLVDRTGSGVSATLVGNAVMTQPNSGTPDYYQHRQYVLSTRDGAGQQQQANIAVAYAGSWVVGIIAGHSFLGNNQEFSTYGLGADQNRESFGTRSDNTFYMNNQSEGLVTVAAPNSTWYERHFNAQSRNGTTNRKFWHDGVVKITDTTTVQYPPDGSATVWTLSGVNGDYLKGLFDVAYMRHADPTSEWMAAEYASWFVPANFYSVAAP